jgi:hypothetical protein
MAYDNTIQKAVYAFAANFGLDSDFINSVLPVWTCAFAATPDQALTEGVTDICIEHHGESYPTLGDVVRVVREKEKAFSYMKVEIDRLRMENKELSVDNYNMKGIINALKGGE